jgi:putative YhdH/YhfP family quinone oxidoreductase
VESSDERFRPGDAVVATSYEIGVAHFGGFAEYARIPAAWTVKLPEGLTPYEAMAIGTAGFTAAMSLQRLEENGLRPGNGPVLVTGATGGVGSTAVDILAGAGYTVAASTGKESEHEFLRSLGAGEILTREEVSAQSDRPLERERWAGAVDPVGGDTLAYILRTLKLSGAVASSGLTGGSALHTTVMPFILRGVSLLGIDSAAYPMPARARLWQRLATDLKPRSLTQTIARAVSLDELPGVLQTILRGGSRGRVVVRL